MQTGIYPGTFDPVTKGHLHIIKRAGKLVDRLIVAVAENPQKHALFDWDTRQEMVRTDIANMHDHSCRVEVVPLSGLLVDFARKHDHATVFRGLRAVSDYEYEFLMTGMNARLAPDIETVFLMAADKWQFVSSSFVKEIARLGGAVEEFVTPSVQARLQDIFA